MKWITTIFRSGICPALALLALVATNLSAAELIQGPQGVVLRSLVDWEGVDGLSASIGDDRYPVLPVDGRADFHFDRDDLCNFAAYEIGSDAYTQSYDVITLDHLCLEPGTESISFIAISDTQENSQAHARAADFLQLLLNRYPKIRFIINAGDIVDRGDEPDWKAYRAVSATYTNRYPIVPVVGNHEYKNDGELVRFDYVYGTEETQDHYYLVDFPLMSLVVLNSNSDKLSTEEENKQTAWLAETLEALDTLNQEKPIIVTYHHAAYSTGVGNIFMPVPPNYIKKHWLPLFEKYKVDLVINGHEHLYERLKIRGIDYLVTGPAAGTLGNSKPWDSEYSVFKKPKIRTATLVHIDELGGIRIESFDLDTGTLFDSIILTAQRISD